MLAYGCIKLIDYGLLFWLSNYLSELGISEITKTVQANIIMYGYIGYMLGMVSMGYLSDRWGSRALFAMGLIFNCILYLMTYFLIP